MSKNMYKKVAESTQPTTKTEYKAGDNSRNQPIIGLNLGPMPESERLPTVGFEADVLKLQEKILNLVTIDSTDIAIKDIKLALGGLLKTKNQTDKQKEAIKKLISQYDLKLEEIKVKAAAALISEDNYKKKLLRDKEESTKKAELAANLKLQNLLQSRLNSEISNYNTTTENNKRDRYWLIYNGVEARSKHFLEVLKSYNQLKTRNLEPDKKSKEFLENEKSFLETVLYLFANGYTHQIQDLYIKYFNVDEDVFDYEALQADHPNKDCNFAEQSIESNQKSNKVNFNTLLQHFYQYKI